MPINSILFTVDVTNLYGNIPIQEAIDATLNLISKHIYKIDLLGLDPDTIRNLLDHCYTNNYVKFGQRFFKQNNDIAMGRAGATDFGLRGQLVPIKGPWRKGPR